MALLSEQLRGIVNQARDTASQQQNVGLAQNTMQLSQAQQQQAGQQAPRLAKQQSQQLAGAATQAQQQVGLQAQQAQFAPIAQGAQTFLAGQQAAQRQSLGQQKMVDEARIADLQRQGALRQNSAKLDQAKRLSEADINAQRRLTSAQLDYDSNLSFLTNKQREDLANLGAYTKQAVFDQRLMFQKTEAGRKFSNDRQLADYAVLSAQSEEQLRTRLQDMKQAAEKEIYALQAAHDMLTLRMKAEFKRAEKTKDYDMYLKLAERAKALKEKQRRKAARGSALGNIIIGGAQIAAGVYTGNPALITSGGAQVAATAVTQ